LRRPAGVGQPGYEESALELIRTIKVMSEVKVVRRWARGSSAGERLDPVSVSCEYSIPPAQTQVRLVAIGASTGGPPVLQTILAGLPGSFPVPVLIVQHIAIGFTQALAEWLAQSSNLPVHVAVQGQPVLPGHAYLAPDGLHMAVGANGRVELRGDEPENGLRPSVACLFRSVANVYGGSAVGVLLTGMGKDGAWELKLMKERGAVTIAQDQDSAVVHGMPGEAIRLGGATYELPPKQIRQALIGLASQGPTRLGLRGNNGQQPSRRVLRYDGEAGLVELVTHPFHSQT
jgi:two-component system, chemotaxis family, protein-glutamate methylesterase/glutaminase